MLHSIEGGFTNLPKGPVKPKQGNSGLTQKSASGFSYSSDSVTLSYQGSGGSQYSIEILKEQLQGFSFTEQTENDKKQWNKLFNNSKKEFSGFYQSVHKIEIEIQISIQSGAEVDNQQPSLADSLPDFWKPEAVAQRIFDFVTGFEGKTDAEGNDFFKLVKDAVLEGVKQALDELGELDDGVKGVLDETVHLLNDKLDAWGKEKGIYQEEQATEPGGLDITA